MGVVPFEVGVEAFEAVARRAGVVRVIGEEAFGVASRRGGNLAMLLALAEALALTLLFELAFGALKGSLSATAGVDEGWSTLPLAASRLTVRRC